MKRIFTSLGLLCLLGAFSGTVFAQFQPRTDGQILNNLTNPKFAVNAPASLKGMKKITLATWGSQLATPLINAPVAKGIDSLGGSPLTNASAVFGKVCLLYRGGGVAFSDKVKNASAAGATGVIIVNNVAGDPIGMSNSGSVTYTIPVVMVTDVDGNAMNAALNANIPVNVSIGVWSLGGIHDLAVLPGFQATPHAMAIPASQLAKGTGRLPYRNFTSGAIVNFGTSAESGITVTDSVVWNPTSGAPTMVHKGSYTVPTIASTDSVKFGFGGPSSAWDIPFANPTTGYFDYHYNLTYGNTDDVPEDNKYSFRQYVTDSIFCKGNYDFTRNAPRITLGIRPGNSTTNFSFGPMFYVADDSFAARKLQFYMSKTASTDLSGAEATALLYKWVDGSNSQPLDSFVEEGELKLVGFYSKVFTTADSSGIVHTIPILDPLNPAKTVLLDSNSWYWATVEAYSATSDVFLGVDENVNYFTRAYEQSQEFGFQEHPEMIFGDVYTNIGNNPNNAMVTFPFGGNGYYVDSTFFDRLYYVPNIAFHISKNKITKPGVGVENVSSQLGEFNVFPVPANNFITVEAKMAKSFDKVSYRLVDIGGRVVYRDEHVNVTNERFDIPTATVAPGIYHLIVMAGELMTTRQVVIRH